MISAGSGGTSRWSYPPTGSYVPTATATDGSVAASTITIYAGTKDSTAEGGK
jgi:hypothetical protein